MASLHLLRILDYWLSMRKYHMITWPFSSPKQLLVQLVTNIFMVERLWKAEKPNNWIWLFLIVEVPPLIVNLLPSCYGLLLKITWVLTPKIASAIIWWSVTKYVAKLSKCTSIKALSNIWSTNSNHTSPLSKQYFFTFGWKLFLLHFWMIFTRLQNLLICMIFGCFFVHQADFYLPVYMHMNFFKTFNGLHPLYSVIIFDVCQQWISFAKKQGENLLQKCPCCAYFFIFQKKIQGWNKLGILAYNDGSSVW